MKSRRSSAGILSPFVAVWRWFLAPQRNPHAAEDRANQRRRDKRKRGAPVSGGGTAGGGGNKARDAAAKTAAPGADIAFVDKAGNVRLTDGGRIVARAAKGSKSAALAAASELYTQREAALDALQNHLARPAPDLAALEQEIAALRSDLRDAPGLGDVAGLEQRFAALEANLEGQTQAQWDRKRSIIARLEALSAATPSSLPETMAAVSAEWANAGSAGAVHDTVLERRYAAALETAQRRLIMAAEQPELLAAERQDVLDDVIELMASQDRAQMRPRLQTLQEAWQKAGGPDDPILDKQFQQMTTAIDADIRALASEAETARAALEQDAAALDARFDALGQDGAALTDGPALRALSKAVAETERRGGGAHRDITDRLRRRVDELQWLADRELDRRRTQISALAQDAQTHLDTAKALPSQAVATLKDWRGLEDAAKAALDGAEAAQDKLRALGRVASAETNRIDGDVRDARKALNEARKSFFESLDESRETNGFRKRALLDRLRHPPVGASVKSLDEHVEQVMTDWKQTGSAGRDSDQALWEEFQEIRASIRGLRDEASTAERDDYSARLAEAFARKRALSYAMEDEIRMGRLVLENQKDAKFEKELRRKERRLEDVRKDLSDIQRKLSKLSKPRAGAAPATADQAAEGGSKVERV